MGYWGPHLLDLEARGAERVGVLRDALGAEELRVLLEEGLVERVGVLRDVLGVER